MLNTGLLKTSPLTVPLWTPLTLRCWMYDNTWQELTKSPRIPGALNQGEEEGAGTPDNACFVEAPRVGPKLV